MARGTSARTRLSRLGSWWFLLVTAPALNIAGCGEATTTVEEARYVGRSACVDCHVEEASAFAGSDHDRAMEMATPATVLGDFAGSQFVSHGLSSTFSRRGDRFVVNTEGPDGERRDYVVAYTFGVRPLQQYLVQLPGGRLQPLSVAWDTRPVDEGGQRWFSLYPDERIGPEDPLHWTRPAQNWNAMCAECHSTNLRKNFDPGSLSYDTRWSEIDVSCEACHGPGAGHVSWALAEGAGVGRDPYASDDIPRRWASDPSRANARLVSGSSPSSQLDTCAPCHSHRSAWVARPEPGGPFDENFRLSLIEEPLYFPDGHMREEVYVTGSFRQSRMYQAGVQCTDCHDPHTLKLKASGNGLCHQCHTPAVYANPSHSNHADGAVTCVDCHMPTRTYMVIDERRDHAFSIPRPDLAATLGTPDACAACHASEPVDRLASVFRSWYPDRASTPHFAEVFRRAQAGDPAVFEALLAVARDDAQPLLVRASAVARFRHYPAERTLAPCLAFARDGSPLLRRAAVEVLGGAPLDDSMPALRAGFEDSVRGVRIAAVQSFVDAGGSFDSPYGDSAVLRVLEEYRSSLEPTLDVPATQLRLADLESAMGEHDLAEETLRRAIRLDELFVPAYVNLADLYRSTGREAAGRSLLQGALGKVPNSAALHHAYGLALVRNGDRSAALEHLEKAAIVDADVPRYSAVYAVALASAGRTREAVSWLRKGLEENPFDPLLLSTMVQYCREIGDLDEADRFAARLRRTDVEQQADDPN